MAEFVAETGARDGTRTRGLRRDRAEVHEGFQGDSNLSDGRDPALSSRDSTSADQKLNRSFGASLQRQRKLQRDRYKRNRHPSHDHVEVGDPISEHYHLTVGEKDPLLAALLGGRR